MASAFGDTSIPSIMSKISISRKNSLNDHEDGKNMNALSRLEAWYLLDAFDQN